MAQEMRRQRAQRRFLRVLEAKPTPTKGIKRRWTLGTRRIIVRQPVVFTDYPNNTRVNPIVSDVGIFRCALRVWWGPHDPEVKAVPPFWAAGETRESPPPGAVAILPEFAGAVEAAISEYVKLEAGTCPGLFSIIAGFR